MSVNTSREDERIEEGVKIDTIRRLSVYLKPYTKKILVVLLLMFIIVSIQLLNPYFLKLGIDHFIEGKDVKGLILLGIGMIALNGAAMFCTKKRIRIMAELSNEILMTIRQELYTHIQGLSLHFFDQRPVGKILARIMGDVNSLKDLFNSSVMNLIPDFMMMIAVVIIMLLMNYRLALVSFIMLPFLLLGMFLVESKAHKRWQIYRKKNSNMNAFVHEDFSGIRVVQGFAAEEKTAKNFDNLLNEHREAFISAVKLNDLFWPMVEVSWGVGTIIVFWYGVRLLGTGTITVGLLVAFTGYLSMFWQPVMSLSNFYNILITNLAGAERIFEILDIKPDIEDEREAKVLPMIQGEVTFGEVTFGYDPKDPVLIDVSFQTRPGETIALVGPTGAGKTSIINLISRFYDVQKGAIFIDGYDVRDVTLESLRSQMGIMLQDTFLFSGTIEENIAYGKLGATKEEIIEAAKAVHAHEFIMKLEKGYATKVNERGSRLSVGQRQLVAFARTLLADPRILILDEATSSIDTHTEKLVQQGIERLLAGRTSFVIAHRLSTIQKADRILVIDQGRIIEEGNHETLMKEKGLYYDLFMAQFQQII
ncbi:MAG: ABC transporter ATP-binding protein [Epulopiscium sp.]|nr:ABC transporter ATP-binding protein [Candidatus Epulonipiscium sp.]